MGNFDAGYTKHRERADAEASVATERLQEEEAEQAELAEQALIQARADRARDMVRRGELELPPEMGGRDPQAFDQENPPLMGISQEDRTLLEDSRSKAAAGQAGEKAPEDGKLPSQEPTPLTGPVQGPQKKLQEGEGLDEPVLPPEITSGTAFTSLSSKAAKAVMSDMGQTGVGGALKSVWHGVRRSAVQTVDLVNDIRVTVQGLEGAAFDSLFEIVVGKDKAKELENKANFKDLVDAMGEIEGESDESIMQSIVKVVEANPPDKILKNLIELTPKAADPETTTGKIISGFSEFIPTYLFGMGLATKTATLARFLTRGGRFLNSNTARRIAVETGVSALTSFIVLDPADPKLGDMLTSVVGEENVPYFMEYLKNGTLNEEGELEADQVMLGRLKNALSDAALGPLFDTVMTGLGSAFRQIRKGGAHLDELGRKAGLRKEFPFKRTHQPTVDLKDVSKEVHKGAMEFDGFTYNMKNGDLAGQSLWSVSSWPEYELRIPMDKAQEIDVTAYINSLVERGVPLDTEGLSVGLWKDKKRGHMVYDLVQTVRTKEEAMELGIKYGQDSIFDLKNLEEVKTGFDITNRASLNLPSIEARISDATSRFIPVENSIMQNVTEAAVFAKRVLDDFARSDIGSLNLNPKGKMGTQEKRWIGNVGAMHIAQGTGNRKAWEKALLTNLEPTIADALTPKHLDQIWKESGVQYQRYANSAWNARKKAKSKLFTLDGDPIFKDSPGTKSGLPALERVMMLFEKGRFRADWYDDAVTELKEMFGEDRELFAKLVAALSPLKKVGKNISAAFQAYQYFKIHGSFAGFFESTLYRRKGFGMAMPNHRNGLSNIQRGAFATGPKVESFLRAILGDTDAIAIDSWMTQIFFGKTKPTDPQRMFMQNWVRDIARRTETTPRQAQAALWVGALMESTGVQKEGMKTLMDIIKKHADRLVNEGRFEVPAGKLPEGSLKRMSMRYAGAVMIVPFLDPEDDSTETQMVQEGFNKLGIEVAGGKSELIEKILRGIKTFLKEQKLEPPRKKFSDRTKGLAGDIMDDPTITRASTKKSMKERYEEQLRIQTRRTEETGTRTDVQVEMDAEGILSNGEMTVDFIKNLSPGTTFSDAEAVAMIKVWDYEDAKLINLIAQVEKHPGNKQIVEEFKKQLNEMKDLTASVRGVTAEAGRTTRVFDDVAGASKVRRDAMHQAFGDFNQLIESDIHLILNALKHANSKTRIQTITQIGKGKKWMNAFMEVWINSLLSGPQTQVANIGSNAFFQVYNMGEMALARKFGQVRHLFRPGGEAPIAPGALSAQFMGMVEGHKASWSLAGEMFWKEDLQVGVREGLEDSAQVVGDTGLKIESFRGSRRAMSADELNLTGTAGVLADALGYFTRTPSRGLLAGDVYAKGVAFHGQLKREAKQQGWESSVRAGLNGKEANDHINDFVHKYLADPPESALEKAQSFSEYITFTDDLGRIGQKIQDLANSHPLLKMAAPFVRTPTNIFKRALERSPLGAVSPKFIRAMKAGGKEADVAMAKIAMGSAAMLTFGMMSQQGLITGRAPVDPALRKAFFGANMKPYSIKIGGRWVSYNRLEPIGMLIGAAADYATILSYTGVAEAGDLAAGLAVAFAQNFSSKTYVRGVASAIHAITYPERGGRRFTADFISSLVPAGALLRQLGTAANPEIKEINSVLDRIYNGIPGLGGTLNPDRGLFGEKRYFSGGVSSDILGPAGFLVDAVSPFYISMRTTPHQEMYKVLNDNDIGVPNRPKTIGNVELNAEQREKLALLIPEVENSNGNTIEEELNEIFESESWESNDTKGRDGLRHALVYQSVIGFYQIALGQLREEDESLNEEVVRDQITTAVRKSDEPETDIESEVISSIGVGQ